MSPQTARSIMHLQGVFVVDWRVRHGAIQLMGQLQLVSNSSASSCRPD